MESQSFESESTVVKKTVKKSVKKSISKKASSSITTSSSTKTESFENSFSNGSLEMVEQQESITSSKSIDTSTSSNGVKENAAVLTAEVIEEPQQVEGAENGVSEVKSKKGSSGRKKSKKKRSDEKENISVVSQHESTPQKKIIHTNQHFMTPNQSEQKKYYFHSINYVLNFS